jgi:transglutaminase-like putative cysteine protease
LSKLYQVRHVTRFRYEDAISENVMEVRKCPMTRDNQRCMSFKIKVMPKAKLSKFEEQTGNVVHNFDIQQPHSEMTLTAESLVEVKVPEELPDKGEMSMWAKLKALEAKTEFLEYIFFSPLVQPTESLKSFFKVVKPGESEDPLTFLVRLNSLISEKLEYVPLSTQADSSVDTALEKKKGVCQDFAHILIGLGRLAGIPCRYVSGYLYHQADCDDRSCGDATHAWMEAYLPGLGWVGFDPANSILAGERHIATALGRDYKDVPPTRGVYRGCSAVELSVAVQVNPAEATHADDDFRRMDESRYRSEPEEAEGAQQQQQQQ